MGKAAREKRTAANISRNSESVSVMNSTKQSKEEKTQQRRQAWKKKLELSRQQKNEKENPLQLGSMERIISSIVTAPVRQEKPKKRVVSRKGRKATLMKEMSQFKKVLKHPAFQDNPMESVSQHLLNMKDLL